MRTKLYGQQKLSEIKQILGGSHDAVSGVRDFELVTAYYQCSDDEIAEARDAARRDLPGAIEFYRNAATVIRAYRPSGVLTTDPYGKPWKMKEMRADKYLTNEPLSRLEGDYGAGESVVGAAAKRKAGGSKNGTKAARGSIRG